MSGEMSIQQYAGLVDWDTATGLLAGNAAFYLE